MRERGLVGPLRVAHVCVWVRVRGGVYLARLLQPVLASFHSTACAARYRATPLTRRPIALVSPDADDDNTGVLQRLLSYLSGSISAPKRAAMAGTHCFGPSWPAEACVYSDLDLLRRLQTQAHDHGRQLAGVPVSMNRFSGRGHVQMGVDPTAVRGAKLVDWSDTGDD